VRSCLKLIGSLVLLAVLAWRLDWPGLGAAFAGMSPLPWLAALAVYLVAQAVSSWRWQLLAAALGCGGPWQRYLAHYFSGMFFSLVLPTSVGGDVVRACYLAGAEGRRCPAFLSVLADRVSGLAVLIALACVAALCCPVQLAPWLAGTVAALGAGALLGVLALPLLPRLPLGQRLRSLVEAVQVCLSRPGLLAAVTAQSLLVQAANVVLVWLIGRGLGLPVPLAYYGVFVPLVALLTLLPVSLNGMGLRELGTAVLLAPLGVSTEQAVTLSVLTFAAFTAAGLSGGFFYLFGRFPLFGDRVTGWQGDKVTEEQITPRAA
jgi:uncharacterized membrane protein YbhN (UPF0104 family)